MTLYEAISATGMTPPRDIVSGRWVRFPGAGKGRSNRAGWCRLITPTLAIFGDWSSNFTATWRDDSHQDDERSRQLLSQARQRERQFSVERKKKQEEAAGHAQTLIRNAETKTHPYLERKGFPDRQGLVCADKLLIPVRDLSDYRKIISVQLIGEDGEKRFIPGSKTRCGIHRIGSHHARRTVLCEGYATGLSIEAALKRLPGPHAVIVCFSAKNLELVAESFPRAVVCADNDESKTGQHAAERTGLRWAMPPDTGTDFNDMHLRHGLHAVTEVLRSLQ